MPTPASRRSPTSTSGRPRSRLGSRLLRARGARVSCLGDLLLERWAGPTIGITGTAGKTTTTALTASILRNAGIDIAVSKGARAGNLWPTADLLERLTDSGAGGETTLLLELTSSHLAFMRSSPTLAAVISFWPDHLELHGTLDRYRAAKEQIVRHQRPGDRVVVNADDASAGFARRNARRRLGVLARPTESSGEPSSTRNEASSSPTGRPRRRSGTSKRRAAHPANVVAAAAIATAAGAGPDDDRAAVSTDAVAPPWRAQPSGTLGGVPVVDDGMAATPTKAAATLARYPGEQHRAHRRRPDDAGGGASTRLPPRSPSSSRRAT